MAPWPIKPRIHLVHFGPNPPLLTLSIGAPSGKSGGKQGASKLEGRQKAQLQVQDPSQARSHVSFLRTPAST